MTTVVEFPNTLLISDLADKYAAKLAEAGIVSKQAEAAMRTHSPRTTSALASIFNSSDLRQSLVVPLPHALAYVQTGENRCHWTMV